MPSPSSTRQSTQSGSLPRPIQTGSTYQAGPSSPQGQGQVYGSRTWVSVTSPRASSQANKTTTAARKDSGSGSGSGSGSVSPNGKERQAQNHLSSSVSNGSGMAKGMVEGNGQATAGPSRIPADSTDRIIDPRPPIDNKVASSGSSSNASLNQSNPPTQHSYSGLPSSSTSTTLNSSPSNQNLDQQRNHAEDPSRSMSSGPKPPPLISRHYGLDPTLRGKASISIPEDPNSSIPLSTSGSFGYGGHELSASSPGSPEGEQPLSKKEKKEKERDKESGGTPLFSVEIKANRFDSRGWPVFSGTAPLIRGSIRMPADIGCQVTLTLAAHTTLGAPAASWQNVATIPYEDGTEKKVFSVTDRFQPNFDLVSARPPTPEQAIRKDWPRHEDYILEIPFDVNLPMGCATRIVDGKLESAHVPLPPSFEISSEGNAKERERQRRLKAIAKQQAKEEKASQAQNNNGESSPPGLSLFPLSRSTSNHNNLNSYSTASGSTVAGSSTAGASTSGGSSILGISLGKSRSRNKDGREGMASNAAAAFRDAVERGFEQVYRIGCYYHMTFQLQRNAKKSEAGTILRIPFLFLGESFVPPNPPPSLPPQISLPPAFLMQSASSANAANAPAASPLGRGWTSIKASSKWSGSGWKSLRRGVEVELHTPSNTVFAPSAIPFLLVVRPNDPSMFNNIPSSPGFGPGQNQSSQAGGFGSPSHSDSQSPPDSPRLNFNSNAQNDSRPPSSAGSAVARWMRGSLNLSRLPPNANISNSSGSPSSTGCGEQNQQNSSPKSPSGGRSRTTSDAARPLTASSGKRPSTAPSIWNSASPPSTAGGRDRLANLNSNLSQAGNSGRGPFGLGSLASASASVLNFGRNGGTTERDSDNSGGGTTAVAGGSNAQGYQCCLSDLIRVSLIQATYCVSASVNETPEKRKRLISLADLEEVDIASLSPGSDGPQDPQNLSMDEQVREEERIMAANVAAKTTGVRILRGLLKVGSDTTPGFRSQGLEVKYAIKVDLIPYSSNTSTLTSAFKNLSGSKSGGASTSGSSVYTMSPSSRSTRARGHSDGISSSGTNTTNPSPAFVAQTMSNLSPPSTPPTLSELNSSGNSSQDDGVKRFDQIGIAYSTNEEPSAQRQQRQSNVTPTQALVGMSSPNQHSSIHQAYSQPQSQYASTAGGSPSLSSARSPSELYGTSQIGSPSRESTSKLSKSVGALWVDVRLVRAAIV